MTEKRRFWIITELFYPDETSTAYILTCIARCLSREYDVHVLCGNSRCGDAPEPDFPVTIHRCGRGTTSGRSLFARTFGMLALTLRLVFTGLHRIGREEQVLVVTNPAPLLVGIGLLRRVKGSRLTLLVHDVFPENTLAAGLFRSRRAWPYRLLRVVFNRSYRSADRLIVLGRDMERVVRAKFPESCSKPIHIVENWADTDAIVPMPFDPARTPGRFVLEYAGNVGRVQGLFTVVECFCKSGNDRLHLSVWGTGAALPALQEYVRERQMENVSFHGAYSRSEQCKVLSCCHLAVISLSAGMYGMGVPSKSYNIMAAGRPILFIGDTQSEIALTVAENRIGYVVPNDPQALTAFFRSLGPEKLAECAEMGRRARLLAESAYAKEIILNKYIRILS